MFKAFTRLQNKQSVHRTIKGNETFKNIGRNKNKPQKYKALPSGVVSSVVKESFLWLGVKRPSMYWG